MGNKVVLVGAGPGDIGFLTLKGKKYISEADCVIYDRLLNPGFLSLTKESCELIYVGKENHNHTLSQDKINELLLEKSRKYKLVVRLKGGDPYVFGRGGEEFLYLNKYGVEVEVVPGISSSIAALATAGIPITHRGLAKGFQVITAHSKDDSLSEINFSELLDEDITLVFLMGLAHVAEIAKGLIKAGRSSETKAAVISSGTTNHQKKAIGTLANIAEKVTENKLSSPAIIVVGKVVELANDLSFFEGRPLFGKKYLLPKISNFNYDLTQGVYNSNINELESQLIEQGAEVVTIHSGTIKPVKCNLEFLASAGNDSIIVFTSANGVKSFFWNLFDVNGLDIRAISRFKFAVIGNKTENTLRSFGIKADYVSTRQTGKDLALLLNDSLADNADIYWLCQYNTSEDFENTLSNSFKLTKTVCYENDIPEVDLNDYIEEIKTCDGAIFTSGSNARFSIDGLGNDVPSKIYSIGPACSKVIREYGFENIHEAAISSYSGIMDLLLNK